MPTLTATSISRVGHPTMSPAFRDSIKVRWAFRFHSLVPYASHPPANAPPPTVIDDEDQSGGLDMDPDYRGGRGRGLERRRMSVTPRCRRREPRMGVRPFGTGPSRPPSLFLSNLFLCRFYTDRTSDGDIGRADRTSVGRMDDHNGNAVDWA